MKKMKKGLGRLQAILIPKSKAKNRDQAIAKARKYGQMHIVEDMKNYYRCKRGGTDYTDYETKKLPNGVQLIYGRDLDGSEED